MNVPKAECLKDTEKFLKVMWLLIVQESLFYFIQILGLLWQLHETCITHLANQLNNET